MAEYEAPQAGQILTANSPEDADAQERQRVKEFLSLAKKRFKLAVEAEKKNRDDALDDLKFLAGDQWPAQLESSRELDGRPCLTINRLTSMKRQITNEQRQQRPAIQINPVGSGSDVDTAEILQGIIRHIEVNSDAEIAYDTGFECAVTGGFGWWEVCTDYVDERSFDQEIFIKRKKNPFTIYVDPSAIEPTYCDADWMFEVEDVPEAEYKRDYPQSDAASLVDFQSIGDQAPDWATKETIRVAKYWHVEYNAVTLCLLDSGSVVRKGEIPQGARIVKERELQERKVVCSKINAIEIIEEYDWLGLYIPLIPVLADDFDIDGERHLAGMVRDAKDPQRMYNYWVSSGTEMIALAPRAPFVGGEGQFEGHEAEWQQANTKNFAFLEYKPQSLNGQPLPPPQRQVFEPPVQAITLMTRQADNDLKSVVGIYDPTLGQNKSDQSGRSIALLQKQSDIANLNFADNLSRAIRYTGKILLDLIPKIYDAPRVQRIISPDGSVEQVGVFNSQTANGINPADVQEMLKIEKIYDLGAGKYDVTVSVGPSYQTKRQEAVASQLEVLKILPPQLSQAIVDMVIRNMDWPQAQEMADRIKQLLPPQLQDNNQDPETQVKILQAQLQQMGQQHELLTRALTEATEVIKTKQIEANSKERIALIQVEKDVTIAEITTKSQEVQARMKFEQDMWKVLHGSAHDLAMQKDQQGHEQDLAETAAAQQPTNGAGGAQANA